MDDLLLKALKVNRPTARFILFEQPTTLTWHAYEPYGYPTGIHEIYQSILHADDVELLEEFLKNWKIHHSTFGLKVGGIKSDCLTMVFAKDMMDMFDLASWSISVLNVAMNQKPEPNPDLIEAIQIKLKAISIQYHPNPLYIPKWLYSHGGDVGGVHPDSVFFIADWFEMTSRDFGRALDDNIHAEIWPIVLSLIACAPPSTKITIPRKSAYPLQVVNAIHDFRKKAQSEKRKRV